MIKQLAQNITITDTIVVAVLLMLIIIAAAAGWRQARAEVKWWCWCWERICYPVKGSNKFVRHPQENMLLKMQLHYGDSTYQPHEFNVPVLSEREKLQRDIEKIKEQKPKKNKKHETPPPSDDDIPVDTGNYDMAQFEDFYKEKFNLDATP